jgi:hypothetical protein
MSGGDEWVVVGGKGKPCRSKPAAAAAGAGAAADGAPLPPQPAALPLLPPPPAAALPGWADAAPGRSGSSGRRARAARSPEERLNALVAAVAAARADVAAAPALAHLRAAMAAAAGPPAACTWERVAALVVYGLGCVEDSRVSRHQLALASLLADMLPGLAARPQLFDPAFSELDTALLPRLGMEVIPVDEGGGRAAEAPTLFYLPHCEVRRERWGKGREPGRRRAGGRPPAAAAAAAAAAALSPCLSPPLTARAQAALCENLLAANWCAPRLARVVILGNSFRTYWERWTAPGSRPGGARPTRLLQLMAAGAWRRGGGRGALARSRAAARGAARGC